uniref:Uncharacterized protein n=1 Tax=Arundo donax TaxID=35708 RepID=A0A0A9H4W3_ARUDO
MLTTKGPTRGESTNVNLGLGISGKFGDFTVARVLGIWGFLRVRSNFFNVPPS